MYETVLIDQNPHWRGAPYPVTVPWNILNKLREYLRPPQEIMRHNDKGEDNG